MTESNKKDMTRRVAVFRNPQFDFTQVWEGTGPDREESPLPDYVRVSEWTTVEFKPLTSEAVAGAEMKSLTKLREKTVDEFAGKLKFIDERIANLRALTGPSS